MNDVERNNDRNVARRVFVADYALPTPDRDSGSVRMFNLLMLLREQGFKITFASMGLEARQPYLADLQGRGVECLYRPYEHSIQQHLRRRGEEYDLVILSRLETAAELQAYAFRWCRRAKVVFDTVDLHFQRLEREADVRDDARLRRLAERQRTEELKLVEQANLTLVVSEVEGAYLAETVPDAKVRVLSNIHQIKGCRVPFERRRDILFIGGFAHPPNTDAVVYFCAEVLPRILIKLPNARFLVVGADPPVQIRCLASDQVKVLGHVHGIEGYLSNCRLSVAPLRFGAGVKGKINQSLAHGLPVVATPLAVEGMFLKHEESVMVADDAVAFADAVVRLYEDPNLWRRLSAAGLVTTEQYFSLDAARAGIKEMLSVCNIAPLP